MGARETARCIGLTRCKINSPIYRGCTQAWSAWPIGSHYARLCDVFHGSLMAVCTATEGYDRRRREKGTEVGWFSRHSHKAGIRTEILLENGNPFPRGCFVVGDSNKLHALRTRLDRRRVHSKEFFMKFSRGSWNERDASLLADNSPRDKEPVYG